jgi:ligand-binding sensor domain-containing protein
LKRLLFSTIIFLLLPIYAFSQSYSYVNYDTKDGLSSSVVYDITQDKDGFIWFATESGVSRFDGAQFHNFTYDDGLPTNVVLKVFADSKGRVWMSGLNSMLFYYYQGRICTRQNDSLLASIHLDSYVDYVAEDSDGNIAMVTKEHQFLYIPAATGRQPLFLNLPLPKPVLMSADYGGKGFLISTNTHIYRLTDTVLKYWKPIGFRKAKEMPITTSAGEWRVPAIPAGNNLYSLRGIPRFLSTATGAWEIDSVTGAYRDLLLPGKNINQVMIDNENNTWLATASEGVYKLASRDYKTWTFHQRSPVFSILKWQDGILAGSDNGRLYHLRNNRIDTIAILPGWQTIFRNNTYQFGSNRAFVMTQMKNGDVLLGFDLFVAQMRKGREPVIHEILLSKSIFPIDDHTVMIATFKDAGLYAYPGMRLIKKIWNGRTTAVHYSRGYYYLGTPQGLYTGKNPDSLVFLGNEIPETKAIIAAIIEDDNGVLWIATQEKGVIGIRDNKKIAHFNRLNGLTSNICKDIAISNGRLWVGTDKGLNEIDPTEPHHPVKTYTTADGLPVDNINVLHVQDSVVYIGSPAGLTAFNHRNTSDRSICHLKILNIVLGDSSMPVRDAYTMSAGKNSLKLSYAGISHRSAGNITFYYRMKGLMAPWDSTKQTTLEFPSLPPGDYEFELMAKNRFGVQSELTGFSLSIKAPYWQLPWFIAGIVLFAGGIIYWFLTSRFRKMREKEWEKIRIRQKINDLEQRVQRAQMNPHFIFNCLNSIQHFIISNDMEATNQYLTEFASLIRQTLDNSEKTAITIDNEIRYLQSYLELEKMRFGHLFDFSIEADPRLADNTVYIPVMFLQPYVENSIRHGFRYKKEAPGFISIRFRQKGNWLMCMVEDNGVGRKKSLESRSKIGAGHFSKGTSLNIERMNTLNEYYYGEKIMIETIDLYDEKNEPAGTRVVIRFPFTTLDKLNPYDTNSHYR